MRLIHCSDFHLDAPMRTALDPKRAKERRDELLMTFSAVIDQAQRVGAAAILMVGDLFDTARATIKTRKYVGKLIFDHPEVQFLSVAGNHDAAVSPIFPDDMFPKNWIEFPADGWGNVVLGDGEVAVSGTANVGRADIYDTVPVSSAKFHIVMLHGQVSMSGGTAWDTVLLSQLQNKGIDYLALGHEHSFRCQSLDSRGLWCYCGCPEGRGFDECGEKGIVLLDTDADTDSRVTFLPMARRTLHDVSVNVEDCDTFAALERRVCATVESIPSKDMVKVTLRGEADPELPRDLRHLERILEDRFYFCRVADACRLRLRAQDYIHDISLKGEFVRTVMASKLSPEEKERVIVCGLRALRGEDAEL